MDNIVKTDIGFAGASMTQVGNIATTSTHTPAIEFDAVSFTYHRHKPFIKNLSVAFEPGKVTSIIGPNGCGKSTMVKLIDGLLCPYSGQVLIDGIPTMDMRTKERARRVAMLSQVTNAPAMTVEALVACGRYPHQSRQGRLSPQDRELVENALALTGIEGFRDHQLSQLSGGERQRAYIAMTLAQDTPLILMDEPTTYLDIGACHDLMRLVRKLNAEEGKTIIMVIHDIDLALRYSDRLVVMEKGVIKATGDVSSVLATGAIDHAFGIEVLPQDTHRGCGYVLFSQE